MNSKTTHSSTAFGYPWTPYRIEWRPTYGLPTREALHLPCVRTDAGLRVTIPALHAHDIAVLE